MTTGAAAMVIVNLISTENDIAPIQERSRVVQCYSLQAMGDKMVALLKDASKRR